MKTTTVPLKEEPAASEVVVDQIKFVAKSATTEGGSQRAVRAAKRTRSREHRLANFRRVTVDFAAAYSNLRVSVSLIYNTLMEADFMHARLDQL